MKKMIALTLLFLFTTQPAFSHSRCPEKLESVLFSESFFSGYTILHETQRHMDKVGITRQDLKNLFENKISISVEDELHVKGQYRDWFLATTDGKDYKGQDIYKVVTSYDTQTGKKMIVHVAKNPSSAIQTKYFYLVAKQKGIEDFLGFSRQPILGMQSVLIPSFAVVKTSVKHGVFQKEIIESFNNYDPRTALDHQPNEDRKSVRHVMHSKTNAGRELRVVFVIENNQIVVLSAYAETRTLH